MPHLPHASAQRHDRLLCTALSCTSPIRRRARLSLRATTLTTPALRSLPYLTNSRARRRTTHCCSPDNRDRHHCQSIVPPYSCDSHVTLLSPTTKPLSPRTKAGQASHATAHSSPPASLTTRSSSPRALFATTLHSLWIARSLSPDLVVSAGQTYAPSHHPISPRRVSRETPLKLPLLSIETLPSLPAEDRTTSSTRTCGFSGSERGWF